MYEKNPEAIGGADYNYVGNMIFDDDVLTLMKNG